MRKYRNIFILTAVINILLIVLLPSREVSGAQILDQFFEPSVSNYVGNISASWNNDSSIEHSQTFIVGTSGILSQVDIKISRSHDNSDLLMDIRPTITGVPMEANSSALLAVSVPLSLVTSAPQWVSIDLNSYGVFAEAGEELALVLRTTGSQHSLGDQLYQWRGEKGNLYPNGSGYWRGVYDDGSTGWTLNLYEADWGFRTYVNIVPIPPPSEEVALDIKPGLCPNSINTKNRGSLNVAILGTEDFDVSQIDPESLALEGVSPQGWDIKDRATPYEPIMGKEFCDHCTKEGHDGYLDLKLKFNNEEIVATFGEAQPADCLVLTITGNLKEEFGGTPIGGEDVVLVKVPGDVNNDGRVDMWDFYLLKASYGKSQGDPRYNAEADFDCNLSVDMYDFFTLKKNYGRWPIE